MLDPRRVDPALRAKYDVPGPRYTSYPPANHFGPVDPAAVRARWSERQGLEPDPGLALYLHVPFCPRRCPFCGCHSFAGQPAAEVCITLAAIAQELELAAAAIDARRPVQQLALGGGSPGALQPGQLAGLLDAVERHWRFGAGAERSIEIDPRTATAATVDLLLGRGFNRFSLGVQDLEPAVIAPLRPGQDAGLIERLVERLRAGGCSAINFDLIYGLPGQTRASIARTADRVVALGPSRIAWYSYAHVPWVRPHQRALEPLGLPDAETKAALFTTAAERLRAGGYQPVGMDHFARPGDALLAARAAGTLRRNFMGYTTGAGLDLVACGPSGISAVGSAYSQNHKGLADYREALAAGRLPIERGFLLSAEDAIRRALIMELFCNFRVDLRALGRRFGIAPLEHLADDFERLQPLRADGLVDWDGDAIRVSEQGRFFIRNVCMVFDRYLETDPRQRVYSRTV